MTTRIAVLLMLVGPLTARSDDVRDFLPLEVGNSWTYLHGYSDRRQNDDATWVYPDRHASKEFTISILRTEVIDGDQYYVFSEAPGDLPADLPTYFIAGKKLRWDGNNLTEHDGHSSFSLYQFDPPPSESDHWREYSISAHGDTVALTWPSVSGDRLSSQQFMFQGFSDFLSLDGWDPSYPEQYDYLRAGSFYEHLGMKDALDVIGQGGDTDVYYNEVLLQQVTVQIPGTSSDSSARDSDEETSSVTITWEDYKCTLYNSDRLYGRTCAWYPPSSTSTTSSSWGQIKQGRAR